MAPNLSILMVAFLACLHPTSALPQTAWKKCAADRNDDCATQVRDEVLLLQAFAKVTRKRKHRPDDSSNSSEMSKPLAQSSNSSKETKSDEDATPTINGSLDINSSNETKSDIDATPMINRSLDMKRSNFTKTCTPIASQSDAHGYLANARYGRTHIEIFRDQLRLMKRHVRTSMNVEPFPETDMDSALFFCHLRLQDLSEVQLKLDHADSILAEERSSSPKLTQMFDLFGSKDQALQKLNITDCDVQIWDAEVRNTLSKLHDVEADLQEASRKYTQSLTNASIDGETVVSNKGEFEAGAKSLQHMTLQMQTGGLGYMRLILDGSQLLGNGVDHLITPKN